MARKKEDTKETKQVAKEVVIVHGDDWVGVYINDKLCYEGHSVRSMQLLELLGIKCRDFECDLDWLEDRGKLPDDLKDVKTG